MAISEVQYSSQTLHKRVRIQRLVVTRDMVVNSLQIINLKMCRRLRSFSNSSDTVAWRFHNGLTQRSVFRNIRGNNKAQWLRSRKQRKKRNRDVIAKEEIQRKKLKSNGEDSLEKCEVLVIPSTPLKFKHTKTELGSTICPIQLRLLERILCTPASNICIQLQTQMSMQFIVYLIDWKVAYM